MTLRLLQEMNKGENCVSWSQRGEKKRPCPLKFSLSRKQVSSYDKDMLYIGVMLLTFMIKDYFNLRKTVTRTAP